jgi:hypothetical protein
MPTTIERDPRTFTTEERLALAFERIATELEQVRIARQESAEQLEELKGWVAPTPHTGEANALYLSGQWVRRDGHGLYDTSTKRKTSIGPPNAPLDPQLRRDVPVIDDAENRQAAIDS